MKNSKHLQRLRLTLRGAVQGVGFRPFVYRLATELGLAGWVNNSPQGVFIELEGDRESLEKFLLRIEREKPPRSSIQSLESSFLDPIGYTAFAIRPSHESGVKTAIILPDIATCSECLREIFDPSDRRYRYPFTNCTHCGPRFSIIQALPYDRAHTTMQKFIMCTVCRAEYENPRDRRFHAQPNACPECGPHLKLWDRSGKVLAMYDKALLGAADAIRRGAIVAVKGLGGFHLVVAAHNDDAVQELRRLKQREEKPFGLMYPALNAVREHCEVSDLEERLLLSSESPIVLLRRKSHPLTARDQGDRSIAPSVAPGNPYLGVMLPYTPLHHLLLHELGFPIVATSGNLSDEPICTDEHEALERLGRIAELFLVHDRPIARHVDDSIVRVIMGREMVLRRARGYAPLPMRLVGPAPTRGGEHPIPKGKGPGVRSALAVGAHLKNTVALLVGEHVFISQHIGDLETADAFGAFRRVISDLEHLYEASPRVVACDLHPEYLSTKYAQERELPQVGVQHHYAHVLACMAENELGGPVLGVSWDGTGYGLDGTIWGGEFFVATRDSFKRVAHFRAFRLPGGEQAIKEPRRAAIGLLYELFGEDLFQLKELAPLQACTVQELSILRAMLPKGLNAPLTTSVGRLFDAVASLTGLRHVTRFEGQAAMELEFALDSVATGESYPFQIHDAQAANGPLVVDWGPLVKELITDVRGALAVGRIAAKFHNALTEVIVAVAKRIRLERIVLTGGCFQNKYLTERAVHRLRHEGFRPYWHQRIPPNDGGIALGQIVAAGPRLLPFREGGE